jgi:hypothetical protein
MGLKIFSPEKKRKDEKRKKKEKGGKTWDGMKILGVTLAARLHYYITTLSGELKIDVWRRTRELLRMASALSSNDLLLARRSRRRDVRLGILLSRDVVLKFRCKARAHKHASGIGGSIGGVLIFWRLLASVKPLAAQLK